MMLSRACLPRTCLSSSPAFVTECRRRAVSASVSATYRQSAWSDSWGRESASTRQGTDPTHEEESRGRVWDSDRQQDSHTQRRGGRGRPTRQDNRSEHGDRDYQQRNWDRSSGRGDSRGGRRRGRFDRRDGGRHSYAQRWAAQEQGHSEIKDVRSGLRGDVQLYGVSPICAALKAQRRDLHALYIQESMDMKKRKDTAALHTIRTAASELDLPVKYVSKHVLNTLTDNRPHQGIMLDCGELPYANMDVLPTVDELQALQGTGTAPPVWLVVDEVSDPQNLGAMVRSAMFLGVAGMLAASRNCAPLSAAASKASAGCLESFPLHDCDNLPRTLAQAASDGWHIIGASASAEALECSQITVSRPTLLVLGSEGSGLRTNVKRVCGNFVKVSGADGLDLSDVDSLNVSVATGVLLHSMLTSAKSHSGAWSSAAA